MVWQVGDSLQGGKYIITQELGRGGFGITYKAEHTILKKDMVIKTINEELRNDPEYPKFVDRFIKEAQKLEQLSEAKHPHIVRIRDLFIERNVYCLVMDFVAGTSLLNLVRKKGKLPEKEAVKYIQEIGAALILLHENNLVHRDAHPGNIIWNGFRLASQPSNIMILNYYSLTRI